MKTKYSIVILMIVVAILAAGCVQDQTGEIVTGDESVETSAGETKQENPADKDKSQEAAEDDEKMQTVFEGLITSVDESKDTLTIDLTSPYKETILLHISADTVFAQAREDMLREGASIRFETNGTMTMSLPAQMTALNVTDMWVAYDDHEKIADMFSGREENILKAERQDIEVKVGDEFLVQLYRNDALDTAWHYEVDDEDAFEYQGQAEFVEIDAVSSLYQLKALTKGEHYLFFKEVSRSTGEVLREVNMQLIVRDQSNTIGAVRELIGDVVRVEKETLVVKADGKEQYLYAPDTKMTEALSEGDLAVFGAEVGEAGYKLVYATPKLQRSSDAGLPIIQHIVTVEGMQDDMYTLNWNGSLLRVYHNGIGTDMDLSGKVVYIEYAVDKGAEANELLHLEVVK